MTARPTTTADLALLMRGDVVVACRPVRCCRQHDRAA
jgi:hypothetical protein